MITVTRIQNLIFFLFFSSILCAQQKQYSYCDTFSVVDHVFEAASKGNYEQTLYYLDQLDSFFVERSEFNCWYIYSMVKARVLDRRLNRLPDAIKVLDGLIYDRWKKLENKEDSLNIGWAYIQKTKYLINLGSYQEAKRVGEETRIWFEDFLPDTDTTYLDSLISSAYLFSVRQPLAIIYERLGAYKEAYEYILPVVNAAIALKKIDPSPSIDERLGNYYLTLGSIQLSQKEYANAVITNKQGLALEHASKTQNASFHLNLGDAYRGLGLYQDALSAVSKAISLYQSIDPTQNRRKYQAEAEAYILLGMIYQDQAQYSASRQAFLTSDRLATVYYDREDNLLSAKALHMLGSVYQTQGNHEVALTYYQSSLKSAIPEFDPLNDKEIPSDAFIYGDMEILQALGGKAMSLANMNKPMDKLALLHFELYDEVEERLRLGYKYETSKLRAEARSRSYYEQAIGVAKRLYEATNEVSYLHRAFHFVEKSKAWVLWEAIHDSQAKIEAGIPESLLSEAQQLLLDIANYQRNIETASALPESDSSHIAQWQLQLSESQLVYRRLLDKLEDEYPEYYALKYNIKVASISDIQQQLQTREACIEYFYGDQHLYAFCIRADTVLLTEMRVDSAFAEEVRLLEQVLVDKRFSGQITRSWEMLDRQSRLVHDKVFASLKDLLPVETSLIVIPDGPLSKIPFEVLQTHQSSASSRHYLLYDYPISYDFSATIHFQTFDQQNSRELRCLGIAPTFEHATTYPLAPIPNQSGLEKISQYVEGTYLYGEKATESQFKALAGEYGILHLATHGKMDTTHEYSWLAFSEDSTLDDDGYLYAYELYTMRLNAELAVLGACETGLGLYQKGEGLMSLARAFAYAGCPALVASLWEAQDMTTTQDILPLFYEGLLDGLPKHDALRRAKLQYLEANGGISTFPFFWAAFVTTGNPAPLKLVKPTIAFVGIPWYGWGGISVVMLMLIGYLRYRRGGAS